MNTKGLSLNTIPPILIPLRFFLTAPVFGILAALLILYSGPQIWTSRWLPDTLALTHLMTIGFMLMVMMGALYQFIPVMIGQLIPGGNRFVGIIHSSLIIGSLSLASGFLSQIAILYWLALLFLGMSLFLFALSLIPLLISKLNDHLIVFLLRILFFVLLVTIGLGLFMLLAYAYPDSGLIYRQYTDIHALWGLIGWVVLLLIAVSSQIIPMFFVTPEFSVKYLKSLSLMIVVTLAIISISVMAAMADIVMLNDVFNLILSMELVFFSSYTLLLINQRKRKLPDVTINFFRLSLFSLLLVIALWWLVYLWTNTHLDQYKTQFELTLGLLLIYGLAASAIIGMLQKIVPFIIYLNLQNLSFKHPESMSVKPRLVLHMKQIISIEQSQTQFMFHISSLFLLIISLYWVQLVWIAGLGMLVNFFWLAYVLLKGYLLFNKNKRTIMSFPEMKMDFGI